MYTSWTCKTFKFIRSTTIFRIKNAYVDKFTGFLAIFASFWITLQETTGKLTIKKTCQINANRIPVCYLNVKRVRTTSFYMQSYFI